jgi:hypothetical protein
MPSVLRAGWAAPGPPPAPGVRRAEAPPPGRAAEADRDVQGDAEQGRDAAHDQPWIGFIKIARKAHSGGERPTDRTRAAPGNAMRS